jgi:hypothetical protein
MRQKSVAVHRLVGQGCPARRCLGLLLVNLGYTGLRSNRENFAIGNSVISAEGMKQGWPGYTDKLVPWRQQ